jgi:hypothetical protein
MVTDFPGTYRSHFQAPFFLDCLTLKIGRKYYPETSLTKYQPIPRNIREERRYKDVKCSSSDVLLKAWLIFTKVIGSTSPFVSIARKKFPWMVGMTQFEAAHRLPTLHFSAISFLYATVSRHRPYDQRCTSPAHCVLNHIAPLDLNTHYTNVGFEIKVVISNII